MSIFAFIVGACLGSFANVIMTRLNALSLLSRSQCLSCGHPIRKRDNIPIISYLIRGGKCYTCNSKYSSQYMWVELAMGAIGVIVWSHVTSGSIFDMYVVSDTMPMYVYILRYSLDMIVFTLLMCISTYDIRHKIVPIQLSLSLIIVGLILAMTRLWMPGIDTYVGLGTGIVYGHLSVDNAFVEILGGLLTALPYALLFFVSRGRWVGFGDVLVFAGVGWAFGLVSGISIFLSSIWIGSIMVMVWTMIHKQSASKAGVTHEQNIAKVEIPFAPFIAIAALLVYTLHLDILGIQSIIMYGL